jgi:hypothetical protein
MKTKFLDLINISTEKYSDAPLENREKLLYLIQSNHNSAENIVYYINNMDIDAYLTGQDNPSIISIYNECNPSISQIGAITSRSLHFYVNDLYNPNTFIHYSIYYIDFFGIDREKDQKQNSRKLLQTHEYNQRIQNPSIEISIIKKDKELFSGIVPLVEYDTYVYKMTNLKLPNIPPDYSIVQITPTNLTDYIDFFYNTDDMSLQTQLFDTMIFPDVGNITALLNQHLLYIYCIKNMGNTIGFYFFKNDKTHYEDLECNSLRVICSIMNCHNSDLFFIGFLYALHQILKLEADYKILVIENIGHNSIIYDYWNNKYTPYFTYKSAYYLFNYIYPASPLLYTRCCIIN